MAIVVVGGHSRNVGKTGVMAGLLDGLRDLNWTAIKITQFGHGVCSADGAPCDCETADHTIAVSEEKAASGTDSGRYLAAGAVRSLWVRTRQGQLVEAMPRIRKELRRSTNTLIESNSILRFLKPDVYLSVLDPAVHDFKESAKRYLDRADVVLLPEGSEVASAAWQGVSASLYRKTRVITMRAPVYVTAELLSFIRERVGAAAMTEQDSLSV